jgi:glycolate oxidase
VGDDLLSALREALGAGAVDSGERIRDDDLRDESLHPRDYRPLAVLHPTCTTDVAAIARLASQFGVPLTPRGSGTGMSGASVGVNGGLVVCFDQMNRILAIDEQSHVAVLQPGVTLRELGDALSGTGLKYPVHPGELSGSLGGNVNTNAGGMRAVRHGVTRHHVLGLELVLIDGTVLRTGGPVVKSSSGYDLTQLVIGSEGTLALVTEVTVKLTPGWDHAATVLAPYGSLEEVTNVVTRILAAGLTPSILEYVDALVMASISRAAGVELGVSEPIAEKAAAYLVIVLEARTGSQLDLDTEALGALLEESGALEVYVLTSPVAARLIEARERAFWSAKAGHATDIIDVVVPRAKVAAFIETARQIAAAHGSFMTGCGHVGDGNVHFSLFQPDEAERVATLHELFGAGLALGGQISGEHGIGRDKQAEFLALSDPGVLALQRKIKAVFDPGQLLNPYRLLDDRPLP